MERALEVSVPRLLDPRFWEEGCDFAVPPGFARRAEVESLTAALAWGGDSAVVFATSGSTGVPKYVVLTKESLLASARQVCAHLGVRGDDVWLCPLPVGHVGGLGVFARAAVSGCKAVHLAGKWDVGRFLEVCRTERATWCSLVPTQVHDLVAAGESAPSSLRGVVVGGGALGDELYAAARKLGWPLLRSFGMTETASQIATARPDDPRMLVMNGWDVRTDAADGRRLGRLSVRGAALFSGYLSAAAEESNGELVAGADGEGWFSTSDRVELVEHADGLEIVPAGRADDLVKVLGELVAVDGVERQLHRLLVNAGAVPHAVAVCAVPDARREHRLVAVIDESLAQGAEGAAIERFNRDEATLGVERLGTIVRVPRIPRSALGKVRRSELVALVQGDI
ncbi:class I adenylate-forming enzyme family protein [Sulfuriroseicoccus oceanibius]|uniref:Long-chain fatty acid--CoA ligase n=1 Tax=Sulfuriroseicoccus oceanibius TaxID=2707525 RepID=A0A6B3L681_9BACT|nr:fatty acid--CoA ligase family protein [Sulfuriroseicoccus oceanibius]QQL46110.1 long-chain fatty acid--CoA ligase [Sulfuriroseicoccus oceanibius]